MRRLGWFLAILLVFSTSQTLAQVVPEICYGGEQKNYTPIPAAAKTTSVKPPRITPPGEETRKSYWGYRHASLHERGIIDQIQKASGNGCCSGIHSGECRVSTLSDVDHTVEIDGVMCPISGAAKRFVVDGLEDDEEVVICAGHTARSSAPDSNTAGVECSQTYCIATRGGY